MAEIFTVLIVLFLVLAVITLVGHGLWALLAWIFRMLFGRVPPPDLAHKCPFCGQRTPATRARCDWCGRDLRGPLAAELADLDAMQRQIERLLKAGLLKEGSYEKLLAIVQSHRQKLREPAAARERATVASPTSSKEEAVEAALVEVAEAPTKTAPVVPPTVSPASPPVTPLATRPMTPVAPAEPRFSPPAVPPAAPKGMPAEPQRPKPSLPIPQPTAPKAEPRVAPPAPPKKSWAESLAGFMEERNIRWGELIGGLLIVGSSVALVLSLWDTLRTIRYFPFMIFVAMTSAVFGAGLYAHHRWKLESTSRGLLAIATLLVPLNFLAMAAFSKQDADLVTLAMDLTALGIFTWLVGLAGKVLVSDGRWMQVLGVLGSSAALLLIARFVDRETAAAWFVAAGCLPVACFAGSVGGGLYQLGKRRRLEPRHAAGLFTLLGTTAFALLLALGLLATHATQIDAALARLSLPAAWAAIPIMAVGLFLARTPARRGLPVAWQTAGLTVALVGMIAMLVALGMAWPHPLGILVVGAIDCAALAAAAFRFRLPALHAGAIACAALVYLTGFRMVYNDLPLQAGAEGLGPRMFALLLDGSSATALGGMFLLLAAISEVLARRALHRHGLIYAGGAGVVAAAGLALVSVRGLHDVGPNALRAAILYGIYGCASLAFAARWRRAELSYLGLGLVAAAPIWALWWHPQTHAIGHVWAAVLAAEALIYGVLAAMLQVRATAGSSSSVPATVDSLGATAGLSSSAADTVGQANRGTRRFGSVGPLLDLYRIRLLRVAEVLAPLALLIAVALTLLPGVAPLQGFAARAYDSPWPVLTTVCLSALYLLLAWEYRSIERTWAGSMILMFGLLHALRLNYVGLVEQPELVALLAHSTLAVIAGVLLDVWTLRDRRVGNWSIFRREDVALREGDGRKHGPVPFVGALRGEIRRVFGKPLGDSALLSSVLVLPVLGLISWASLWSLAGCLLWLTAIWLIVAWRHRDARLFAAHQAMLMVAALVATTAWLQGRPGGFDLQRDLSEAGVLQTYGISLGLLVLVWAVARILLCGDGLALEGGPLSCENIPSPPAPLPQAGEGSHDATAPLPRAGEGSQDAAGTLLCPGWPTVDWIVRHTLVAVQWLLIVVCLLPGMGHELRPIAPAATAVARVSESCGGTAWLLLGILAAVTVVTLWERWRHAELTGSLLLAVTAAGLIAGQFAGDLAVASALRWTLAVAFVVCSLAVWQREYVLGICQLAHARIDVGPLGPRIARTALVATAAAPVLAVTVLAAMLQIGGTSPGGPAADSFFERLGPNVSYVAPLMLVLLGLVGHAVRERSAGYAFSAGLVAELIVTLGYALRIATDPKRSFEVPELVTLIQLATIMAAAWAGAWLAIRQRLNIWREGPDAGSARVLMNLQLGMGAAGNAMLLTVAALVFAVLHPHDQAWSVAAGKPLGWVALLSVMAAYVYRRVQAGRRPHPQMVGLLGLAVMALLACTVQWQYPDWGYRTLMLGWATYALFIVLATWWVASVRTLPQAQGPPQALIRAAAVWVRIAGLLAVLLGLRAAFWYALSSRQYEELLWAAASIAIASGAGAAMAVWQRREGWAFSAALGVNLAASLVVWYFRRNVDFDLWWLSLVQANVIASAAVAIVWLAARRRLYQLRELSLGDSPLLAVQTVLPVAGNLIVLIVPVVRLVLAPVHLPPWMAGLAEPAGWLALLLAAAAAAWYLHQTLPGHLPHVLGGLLLGAGVLCSCHTVDYYDGWLAYQTLVTAWAAAGMILLGIGMAGRNRRTSATGPWTFSPTLTRQWLALIATLVVALAVIHGPADRAGAWWYLRAILATGLTMGLLAMWQRLPGYVYVSGLLLNVAATIAWTAWGSPTPAALMHANVLALAAGSVLWSLLKFAFPDAVVHPHVAGRSLPFAHLAARVAVGLIVLATTIASAHDIFGWRHLDIQRSDWIGLLAAATAVTILIWDRESRFSLAGLYALGLTAVGMALCARNLGSGRYFLWVASCEIAGFALVAAVCGWLLPMVQWSNGSPLPLAGEGPGVRVRGGATRRPFLLWLGIPEVPGRWSLAWYPRAQAVIGAVAVMLSVWITLDVSLDGMGQGRALFGLTGRLAGVAGLLISLGSTIVMAWQTRGPWRRGWQHAAIAAGLLLNASIGFAGLDPTRGTPTGDAPWLHRSISLMVAAVMMSVLSTFGLRKVLSRNNDWIAAGSRSVPALGGVALLMLALVLVQEVVLFDPVTRTPMAVPAIVVVAVALAALVAACLAFALRPDLDPLQLSDRGRTAYVYAAEALLGIVFLHVWLTTWLLSMGIMEKYWMLIVMAIAFAGAGLAELFHRRSLPVLSEPLERTALMLPLAPAVGFWLPIHPGGVPWFGGNSPAMWLLMGLFYGLMAVRKQSIRLGGLAIFTANMGLWVMWQRQGLDFFHHPQLWLIPIAMAALVAEHLDRRRLGDAQRTGLRYLALSMIYVSSTTEFLRGVGESAWLPLVLVGLSVAGVLAGVLLRVRSFLYLGVTFLSVVIVRMIVFAAFERGHVWVFWTCCILLGAAIIALFAAFEKRRNDILAAVERLKDWDR